MKLFKGRHSQITHHETNANQKRLQVLGLLLPCHWLHLSLCAKWEDGKGENLWHCDGYGKRLARNRYMRGDQRHKLRFCHGQLLYFAKNCGRDRIARRWCWTCVGTARASKGWPPKPIANKRFNTLYHYDDDNGFFIFCWVDNNVVTMVSTIHSGEEVIKQRRRRPRDNQYKKQFLPLVFKERAVADVEIPQEID